MPFGFGFRCVPPPPAPTEEIYKRLGVDELQCTISLEDISEDALDSVVLSLTYINEKQLLEAYSFLFVYEDEELSLCSPCTLSYDGIYCYASFAGFKLKTMLTDKDITKGHIMFFKRGLLK